MRRMKDKIEGSITNADCANGVKDYNDANRTIKIGFAGAGLNTSNAGVTYLGLLFPTIQSAGSNLSAIYCTMVFPCLVVHLCRRLDALYHVPRGQAALSLA